MWKNDIEISYITGCEYGCEKSMSNELDIDFCVRTS